jgi:Crp-like helix-turn-helix domain
MNEGRAAEMRSKTHRSHLVGEYVAGQRWHILRSLSANAAPRPASAPRWARWEARGTLLTVSISQKDIAGIVGASRPRVTEHLGQMERDHLLFRQGRQFIVSAGKLSNSLAAQAAWSNNRRIAR